MADETAGSGETVPTRLRELAIKLDFADIPNTIRDKRIVREVRQELVALADQMEGD